MVGHIREISRLGPEESRELRGCPFEAFYPHDKTKARLFIAPGTDDGGQESGASSETQPGQAGCSQDRSASWGSPLGSVSCRIPEHSSCSECRRPTPAVAEFRAAARACSSQSGRRRGCRACGGPGVERKGAIAPCQWEGSQPALPLPTRPLQVKCSCRLGSP